MRFSVVSQQIEKINCLLERILNCQNFMMRLRGLDREFDFSVQSLLLPSEFYAGDKSRCASFFYDTNEQRVNMPCVGHSKDRSLVTDEVDLSDVRVYVLTVSRS